MQTNSSNQHPELVLTGDNLTVKKLTEASRDCPNITLSDAARKRIQQSRETLVEYIQEGGEAYGVTTGVGSQKNFQIQKGETSKFNRKLVIAHATVVSDQILSPDIVRSSLIVQINKFANGRSGVRQKLVDALCRVVQSESLPSANVESSVGAGDLVPLAQISLSLLGIPNPLSDHKTAIQFLESLRAKEALSLINSNSVSLGDGALVLQKLWKLLTGFDVAACLSLEGFRGNSEILKQGVERANPESGHKRAIDHMRQLLRESKLLDPESARNLQDPLSFRCAPQVNGAAHDGLEDTWTKWEQALNAVEDNPVVDLENEELIHHGNMDATYLTLAMDRLRSALAKVVEISTRRLDKIHWPVFSGLPSGLVREPGPGGGVQFLNMSHIAEAHAANVREHSDPALLHYQGQMADGVEDHASLLPHSVRKTKRLWKSATVIQAIELAIASWAIQRRDIPPSDLGIPLQPVFAKIRNHLPVGQEGQEVFDLRPIVDVVRKGEIHSKEQGNSPPLE